VSEIDVLYGEVADLALLLEAEMRRLELWSRERPSEQALASTQPFCIDTLSFPEWLQFIFLERIRFIVQEQAPLPANSDIVPLAEEYFRASEENCGDIISLLGRFDRLITEN